MLTTIKIIGSAVAIACALAVGQLAPPAHATQAGSDTGSARGTAWPKSTAWPWPLIGEVVTAYRNGDDPYAAGQHRGVDIAAPVGTPARAVVAGSVSFSGRLPDGGNVVTLRSSDGEYLVSYLHLATRAVSRGAAVAVGDTLGSTGTTGRRSIEQPHLHLSVRVAATRAYVDPMGLLGEPRLAAPNASGAAPDQSTRPQSVRAAPKSRSVVPLEEQRPIRATVPSARSERATKIGKPAASSEAPARPVEAHAANGNVKAPAPIELAAKQSSDTQIPSERVTESPTSAKSPARAARIAEHDGPPLRAILLAVTALALVGLFANRRPRAMPDAGHPLQPPPAASEDDVDVVALEAIRPRASREAHGGAGGRRP